MTPALKAQVLRFIRIFVVTLLPVLVAFNGNYERTAVVAAVVAAAEVAFRTVRPAVDVKTLEQLDPTSE